MIQKRKILYVHHGGGLGGAPNSLYYSLSGLDRDRFDPIVACDFFESNAREFFEECGFPPIDLRIARFTHVTSWWPLYSPYGITKMLRWAACQFPRSAVSFLKLLDLVKPDLVHLNSLTLAHLAVLCHRRRTPVVLHVREPVHQGTVGLRKCWLKRIAVSNASRIIYICEDNRDRLTGAIERACVIYEPLPWDQFVKGLNGTDAKRRHGIPPEVPVLLFPGGSSPYIKGLFVFLEALSLVKRAFPNVVAIIPGLETETARHDRTGGRIRHIVRSLRLEESIVPLPFIFAVEQYYASADVVVAPFVIPHFARAVVEAGAMGKPVVASRIGGISEVVSDGETGLLVTPGDPVDLAKALISLLGDRNYARKLGDNGFRMAKALYDVDRHSEQIMNVYDQVLRR